jgi:hypothetical protein
LVKLNLLLPRTDHFDQCLGWFREIQRNSESALKSIELLVPAVNLNNSYVKSYGTEAVIFYLFFPIFLKEGNIATKLIKIVYIQINILVHNEINPTNKQLSLQVNK